jgi:hypothetical protein
VEFSSVAGDFLLALGRAFAKRAPPPTLDGFNAALARLLSAMEAISHDEKRVALGFAFEQLQRNLHDLELRAREFARVPVPSDAAET